MGVSLRRETEKKELNCFFQTKKKREKKKKRKNLSFVSPLSYNYQIFSFFIKEREREKE